MCKFNDWNVRITATRNVCMCMTRNVRIHRTRNVRLYMTQNVRMYMTRNARICNITLAGALDREFVYTAMPRETPRRPREA